MEYNFNDTFNNGTTSNLPQRSAEDLAAGIKQMLDLLDNSQHNLIKIYRASGVSVPFITTQPDKPTLEYYPILPDNVLYIVSGVGIVAGKKTFALLDKMNIRFEWSDTYIPLEEQDSDVAKILNKWIMNRFEGILLQSILNGK
jgi:hypothetical protein